MKVKYLLGYFLSIALFGASTSSFAYHYGMAGCGVGALILKDKPGKIQLVAAVLNDFITPQTSAITSGTSNCYDTKDSVADLYIESNKMALLTDISRGEGETIDGLAKIYSCNESKEFAKVLKQSFKNDLPDDLSKTSEIKSKVRSAIKNHKRLRDTCATIS